MDGQQGLLPNFASLFNAIASIDQRLSRIEAALHIPPLNAPIPPQLLAPHPIPQGLPSYPQDEEEEEEEAVMPLQPPPEGLQVSSRETMQDELDAWTLPRGFSMRIAGTSGKKGTPTAKRRIRWACFRGGYYKPRASSPEGPSAAASALGGGAHPDRGTKKCDCPFKFEMLENVRDSDRWYVHYPNNEPLQHNHGPTDKSLDPRARKIPVGVRAEVDRMLNDGWQVPRILHELRARGFDTVRDFDLRNRKRALQRKAAKAIGEGPP